MIRHNLWYWATFAFLLWVGVWLLHGQMRAYRLSGYRFYLLAGCILSAPFFILALWFYFSPGPSAVIPFLFVILVTRIGAEWAKDREEMAAEQDPERWRVWQNTVAAQNWIGRLFL